MDSNHSTIIRFEYGRCYSKKGNQVRWISREERAYTLMMKTSIEKVTYAELVDKLCRKIQIYEATAKLKISYILLVHVPKKPSYILDDEDVLCYLTEVNKDGCRSVLHVELIKDVEQNQVCEQNQCEQNHCEQNQGFEQVLREDLGSAVVESNEVSARANDGIMTLYSREPPEENELVDYVAYDENVGMCGDIEAAPNMDNSNEFLSHEWEDGINVAVGQEFGKKSEVQDLVEKASHMNCFEFDIIKSDTKLYVVKCCDRKNGCKWSLRAVKTSNSDYFSVRTYNKMHTCSRATTSTSRSKRKGTPSLVASLLHDVYPGLLKTPTPKTIIGMVQGTLSVKVSYSTALRGKKKAASDVRGSPVESFNMLYSYMYMLEKMNPGTVTHVEVDEENMFKYLFFALGSYSSFLMLNLSFQLN